MSASATALTISALYLLASLVLGLLPGRKSSDSATGYVAGDRTLGLLLMYFITGATVFSAFAFLGGPGWAYSRGAAAFYILAYGALGFVPFYFLGPRAARLGRRFGFVTQAEMVGERFDSRAIPGVMALVSLIAFVPYLALQIKGAGLVVNTVSLGRIPEWIGSAVVYSVVMLYVLRSGVLGVGWTNTFQGAFMMLLAWGLGLYLPYRLYGGVGPMFERLLVEKSQWLSAPGLDAAGAAWGWGEYSSAVLVSIVGFSVWPHLFMKAFTARDEKTIRQTVVLYPTFQIFLVPLFLIGFCGVLFEPPPAAPDQILPHMLMQMEIPALLVGLFCAGALAASMSSGDAMAHASASIAVRDGLLRACRMKLTEQQQRLWIQWGVVAVLLASYAVAVLYDGTLVPLLLFGYGMVVQFAPVIVATLYWRRATAGAVLAGLVAGGVTTLCFVIWPDLRPLPVHPGLQGVLCNIVVLVAVSWLSNSERSERSNRFVDVASG